MENLARGNLAGRMFARGTFARGTFATPIGTVEHDPVRTTLDLEASDLLALADGTVLAIRLPNFCPEELCDRFVDAIMSRGQMGHYAVAPDIGKLGMAIFDAASDPSALEEYYAAAPRALKEMRAFFHPYLSPMDRLRLILQEVWPRGASIENLHGKTMFCGLVRTFEQGSEARPHQDMTHWDVPSSLAAHTLRTQFACNVYLNTAQAGGSLELWEHGFTDRCAYDAARTPNDYGLDRRKIGPSAVNIDPMRGELIIFDARKIHAVNRIHRGARIAVSCFIGYRGPSSPLTVYS